MRRHFGFTITELLVVITIVVILVAILFPVFSRATEKSKQVVWHSHIRQVSFGHQLYLADYDDRFAPARYTIDPLADSRTDRTWVQLILPYTRSMDIFLNPQESNNKLPSNAVYDEDLVPGDYWSRYYTSSKQSNIGYNFVYLAPIYQEGTQWISVPRQMAVIEIPGETLAFADSRDKNGAGGYLIFPPCRFEARHGNTVDSFGLNGLDQAKIFNNGLNWDQDMGDDGLFGGIHPWFFGRVATLMVDGSLKSVPFSEMVAGCDLNANPEGLIFNNEDYFWGW